MENLFSNKNNTVEVIERNMVVKGTEIDDSALSLMAVSSFANGGKGAKCPIAQPEKFN